MRKAETLVPLGVVTGAHGVHGMLRVKPYNPSSTLLLSLARARLRPPGGGPAREVELLGARGHGAGVLLSIAGCEDRETALSLRGHELCVSRAELPEPGEGEHYLVDLVGLQARTADGRPVGEVIEAVEYPASQVLRVAAERGVLEVPLAPPYVVEIRLDEGAVIVDHVDELDVEAAPSPARGR